MSIISETADAISGKLDIFPVVRGRQTEVEIWGDPDGLRSLAHLLITLADFQQDSSSAPSGSREHTRLSPETHLGWQSSHVQISRADAKGTGELPGFMNE